MSPPTFRRIPTIPSAQELLDQAFRRASRISVQGRTPLETRRNTELARVRSVQNALSGALRRISVRMSFGDSLDPFYSELVGILVDVPRVARASLSLRWASRKIEEIGDLHARKVRSASTSSSILEAKRAAYGRISSLVEEVSEDLEVLGRARESLRSLPSVDPSLPTLLVAGYPNVGKSSLVRRISSGKPKVAPYPFTTKGIVVGHFERKGRKFQVVDTPGLLDRPTSKRNAIELQALAALRHLAGVVLFLVDPTEGCGYPLREQEGLLGEVEALFPGRPLLVVETKGDLLPPPSKEGRFRISSQTGEGVEELVERALFEWERGGKVLAPKGAFSP